MSAARPLLISVLGTGRMAALHVRALQALAAGGVPGTGATLTPRVLLYGRNAAKAAEMASGFPVIVDTTTDLDTAVSRPDVDAVDNCLTNALHYEPLLRAVRAGKHAFTDKPLAMELREAEELLAAAERAGIMHGIVQNMRFQPGPAAARRLLEEGALGDVFHARVVFGYFVPRSTTNRPSWFYRRAEAGGGIIHDMMAHFFDLWESLLGPVDAVQAFMRTGISERLDEAGRPFGVDVEDAATVNLRMRSGVFVNCFISWIRRPYQEVPEFEIDGSRGTALFSLQRLRTQLSAEGRFRYDPTRMQDPANEGWDLVPTAPADPFEVQLRDFIAAIASGRLPEPNWRHAVRAMHLIEAAYQSADRRTVVAVEPVKA
jgi:predicted dehydrogenase